MEPIVEFLLARITEDELAVTYDDPARVEDEALAKRRLLEIENEEVLRILASTIYADHPDFDPAWTWR